MVISALREGVVIMIIGIVNFVREKCRSVYDYISSYSEVASFFAFHYSLLLLVPFYWLYVKCKNLLKVKTDETKPNT